MKAYLALLSVLACVALTLAQNCELQGVQIANKARDKIGSADYSFSGWYNVYAYWFHKKDHWYVAETVREAEVEGGWRTVGYGIFEHDVPESIYEYKNWWVLSGGNKHEGWYWDTVNCEQPCLGDIMAGPVDGSEDGEQVLGIVTSTNPTRSVHVDTDSGELVENSWGFELFGDPEKRKHYVCWRYL